MDKDDVVHIYNGILLSHQKSWDLTIYIDMDGTGGYYAEQNKSTREIQLSNGFTHVWNLRGEKQDHKGWEWKIKQYKLRKGDKP